MILARHGRTAANATGVLAGRGKGVHLDDEGVQQARSAAERLTGLPLAVVVTSPLERCRETAAEIARQQGGDLRPVPERRLLECDYGAWTGRELASLVKEPAWATVQAHPSAAAFPDGETLAQMSARAVAAVRHWNERVEQEHGPDAVWLAVTHGDVVKAILADALGMHLDLFQRLVVDPASLSVIRYTAVRPFVLTVNSVAGDLSGLRPPAKRRRASRRGGPDAAVGGGAGEMRRPTRKPHPGTA